MLKYGSPSEKAGSAWSLGLSKARPDKAVPLLQENLSSTNNSVVENCAIALGNYGPQAAAALPKLESLLTHPKLFVRKAASNALFEISRALPSTFPASQE